MLASHLRHRRFALPRPLAVTLVRPVPKQLFRALLLSGMLLVVAAGAAGVAAGSTPSPCWKLLLGEWYGGKITTIYKPICYRQAIAHLPVDAQVYSSARQDIEAAEIAAKHHKKAPPEKVPPPSTTTPAGGATTTPGGTTTTPTESNPPKKKHGLIGILDDLTPGNPQSFPLPLLVLGALAILLVIAGGAGMVWQRTHPGDADQTQA
jgi:hypothetical protein